MTNEFNKPPHVNNAEDAGKKRRIPVFILIIVGIFLASLIFYMLSDKNPKSDSISPNESVPAVQGGSSANAVDPRNTENQDTANAAGR